MWRKHTVLSARFFLLSLSLGLMGCETIAFYGQAVGGQLSILSKRQPIDSMLAAPETSVELRRKLELVMDIRRFADQELSLPVGDSYSSFVDLHRPSDDNYVVWNVFAAGELALTEKSWCYLLIGCAHYRGYFNKQKALRLSQRLQKQGFDT